MSEALDVARQDRDRAKEEEDSARKGFDGANLRLDIAKLRLTTFNSELAQTLANVVLPKMQRTVNAIQFLILIDLEPKVDWSKLSNLMKRARAFIMSATQKIQVLHGFDVPELLLEEGISLDSLQNGGESLFLPENFREMFLEVCNIEEDNTASIKPDQRSQLNALFEQAGLSLLKEVLEKKNDYIGFNENMLAQIEDSTR